MSHAYSEIELEISCENLPHSSSNQVIMFVKDSQTQEWVPTSNKTEKLDSFNPKFVENIIIDYNFAKVQQLRFVCMSKDEEIGHYDCSLGSIFSSSNKRKTKGKLSLVSGDESHDATIIISAEEVTDSKDIVTLQITLHNIAEGEQALLVLSRVDEDGNFFPVHRKNISSLGQSTFEIRIVERKLCNGDRDRTFKIEVKNDEGGVLGECKITLSEFIEEEKSTWFTLRLPNGMDAEDYKLEIKGSSKEKSSFLDYITGGTQIHLVVAIDFTESNGDPEDPKSLHYIGDENKENDYQQAIRSVGTILEQYDSDKMIPVYGFGARFDGKISHAYPLNNNPENPEVRGIDGVMEVYKETVNSVELYYPTNFSPVINKTVRSTIKPEMEMNKDMYCILLIITDGVITDMDTTIRSIVRAKELPFSIIIVGVGDEDFTNMKALDADEKPLAMGLNNPLPGKIKAEDMVQFVAMREFKSGMDPANLLAEEVMKEIPDQFMSYMRKNNI